MKVRGEQMRPRNREREKLRVARAERKRPRRTRENDFVRRNCCVVGWRRERRTASRTGRATFEAAKLYAAVVKSYAYTLVN